MLPAGGVDPGVPTRVARTLEQAQDPYRHLRLKLVHHDVHQRLALRHGSECAGRILT